MTSAEPTSATLAPEPIPPVKAVHPLLDVFGILLDALIATGTPRLITFVRSFPTIRLLDGQIGTALMRVPTQYSQVVVPAGTP